MIFSIFATKKLKKTFDKIKKFNRIHSHLIKGYVMTYNNHKPKPKPKQKHNNLHITYQEAKYFLDRFLHTYGEPIKYHNILEDMEYYYQKPASEKVKELLSKRLNDINRSRNKNKIRILQNFLWCVVKASIKRLLVWLTIFFLCLKCIFH